MMGTLRFLYHPLHLSSSGWSHQDDCEISGNSPFVSYLRDCVIELYIGVKIISDNVMWKFGYFLLKMAY